MALYYSGGEELSHYMMAGVGSNLTGTVWSACPHIITTSVGAGVLSLAWAMAQLGWLGCISILLFCTFGALYAATLLADCYRFPDPVTGKRSYSCMEAVKAYLGETIYKLHGWTIYLNLATIGIVPYKNRIGIAKMVVMTSNIRYIPHVIGFGIVEIFFSQLPNFQKHSWLPKLAAIMSFGYTFIGIGLSMTKIISALPFFSDMLGLLGALGYWSLIVYIPVEMHIVQNKIVKGTIRWLGLQLLSLLCLILSLAAHLVPFMVCIWVSKPTRSSKLDSFFGCASGAIHGLYMGLKAYKVFQFKE
ncbi:amino acid permease 8-like [Pyrus ussuriensis x Pyrus communis]|uniref:Amino acid permease 8-like n=1 Tax=Pyrus ussuriensis x Pyrus communis TaxID=2448454 RepID=A0A5N5GW03_9ROSA|nr:amino acid permease 8-like [Pyrus ussuriensis x Pyrus communis]